MAASKHTSAIISAKGSEGGHFKNTLMRKFPETLNNLSFNMLLEEQRATASINFQPLDVLKFEIQAGGKKKNKTCIARRLNLELSAVIYSACRRHTMTTLYILSRRYFFLKVVSFLRTLLQSNNSFSPDNILSGL